MPSPFLFTRVFAVCSQRIIGVCKINDFYWFTTFFEGGVAWLFLSSGCSVPVLHRVLPQYVLDIWHSGRAVTTLYQSFFAGFRVTVRLSMPPKGDWLNQQCFFCTDVLEPSGRKCFANGFHRAVEMLLGLPAEEAASLLSLTPAFNNAQNAVFPMLF